MTVQSMYSSTTVAHRTHRALRPINDFFAVTMPAFPFTNFSFFFSPDRRFCFNSSFVSASLVSEGAAFSISVWLERGFVLDPFLDFGVVSGSTVVGSLGAFFDFFWAGGSAISAARFCFFPPWTSGCSVGLAGFVVRGVSELVSSSSSESVPFSASRVRPCQRAPSSLPSLQVQIGKEALLEDFTLRLCTLSQPPWTAAIIAGSAVLRFART